MPKTEGTSEDDLLLLTVPEACKLLRCSRATLYNLRNAGRIEMLKFGHRTSRVVKRSIDKLLAESQRPIGRGNAA
jgi:excisionase family DNA binding protein